MRKIISKINLMHLLIFFKIKWKWRYDLSLRILWVLIMNNSWDMHTVSCRYHQVCGVSLSQLGCESKASLRYQTSIKLIEWNGRPHWSKKKMFMVFISASRFLSLIMLSKGKWVWTEEDAELNISPSTFISWSCSKSLNGPPTFIDTTLF